MGYIKNPIVEGDGDPRHGTPGGYNNHNCRCPMCREAWAENHWQYMQSHPEQQEKARWRTWRARQRVKTNVNLQGQ